MWCAEWASRDERLAVAKQAGDAVDLRGFQRLLERERREDGGDALGEHGFAGARRPDEQNVVAAGSGDLERALDGFLALDFGEVQVVVGMMIEQFANVHPGGIDLDLAF